MKTQLEAIRQICKAMIATTPKNNLANALATRILSTYPIPQRPSGGMVDTLDSKSNASRRPSSSLGRGTTAPNLVHALDLRLREKITLGSPDDVFEWADGTRATRAEIEQGDYHFMSDDYTLSREPEMCGGCGQTDPSKRCVGCFHEFE